MTDNPTIIGAGLFNQREATIELESLRVPMELVDTVEGLMQRFKECPELCNAKALVIVTDGCSLMDLARTNSCVKTLRCTCHYEGHIIVFVEGDLEASLYDHRSEVDMLQAQVAYPGGLAAMVQACLT